MKFPSADSKFYGFINSYAKLSLKALICTAFIEIVCQFLRLFWFNHGNVTSVLGQYYVSFMGVFSPFFSGFSKILVPYYGYFMMPKPACFLWRLLSMER